MKKIFAFMAVALMAFSFASCDKKGGNEPEDPQKQDTARTDTTVAPKAIQFTITVSEIEATSAHVAVVPSDKNETYYYTVAPASEIAGMSDEEIAAAVIDGIQYNIMYYYYYYGQELAFEDFLSKGDSEYTFDELDPSTDYVAFALQMDANANIGTLAKKAFITPEMVAEKTEDIVLTAALMDDECATEGWWQVMAAPADSSYFISISPLSATQAAGTWTIDDMDPDWTFIRIGKGYAAEYYSFVSCDVVTTVENGAFTLTGTALAKNAVEYHFNISGTLMEEEVGGLTAPARKAAPAIKRPAKKIALKK